MQFISEIKTTGVYQNLAGSSTNTGFFLYGYPEYNIIRPGWTCVETGAVVTVVGDGISNYDITTVGTPFASGGSYSFTGPTGIQISGGVTILTPPPPPSVVSTGLVLNLDAGDITSYPGSGTVWTDTVGSKVFDLYNGGRTSPVKTDPPIYNSGNGGYIQFTNSKFQWAYCTSALPDLNSYSVDGWWNPDSVNTSASIFDLIVDRSNSRYNYGLGMGRLTANKFQLYHLKAGQGPKVDSTNNADTYFNTGWWHICGTYNNATAKMNLYINGALAATEVTISGGTSPLSGGAGIHMATRNDTTNPTTQSNFLNGGIAVARIYNVALTASQVSQNYEAQRERFGL